MKNNMSTSSRLDLLYRRILLSKFFTKGWGHPEHLLKLLQFRTIISDREQSYKLVDEDYPIQIIKEEVKSKFIIQNGTFLSPVQLYLKDVLIPEVKTAHFQLVIPRVWKNLPYKPICIHLAGTGDHFYWKRRLLMVKPLLKHGIGSIILENPFYGYRKPKDQYRSCLLNVSDLFVMGSCVLLECIVLLHYCEKLNLGPLGITGVSLGGYLASIAASGWPRPLVLVPCLSWSTASPVFTEGVLSESIDWDLLQQQYDSNKQYSLISKFCDHQEANHEWLLKELNYELEFADPILDKYKIKRISKDTNLKNINSHLKFLYKLATRSRQNMKLRDRDAFYFMKQIMDDCTHLKNYSPPFDTNLITVISAKCDAYVPKHSCTNLGDIWPLATIKSVDAGHIGAYIRYFNLFRDSIVDGYRKAMTNYPPP